MGSKKGDMFSTYCHTFNNKYIKQSMVAVKENDSAIHYFYVHLLCAQAYVPSFTCTVWKGTGHFY